MINNKQMLKIRIKLFNNLIISKFNLNNKIINNNN